MRKFTDFVQDQNGNGLPGASIQVNIAGSTAATLYSDQGITPLANPLTSGALGVFSFYVADGRYDLVISGTGITTTSILDIEIADLTGTASGADSLLVANTLSIGGGTTLTTSNATGAGSLVKQTSPTLITPVLGVASATSLAVGGGTALATTNQTGTGSLVLATSPSLTTPSLGVASATSIAIGGGTALATSNQTGTGNLVLATSPTIASPVINGTPSGTGIPTLLQKKGTGGGTYTGSNTTYADVDATNLSYTVTIPTGWKLAVWTSFSAYQSTAVTEVFFALADGGVALQENEFVDVSPGGAPVPVAMNIVITGDGASHTVRLQAKTNNAADAWNITNVSSSRAPIMSFILSPSN